MPFPKRGKNSKVSEEEEEEEERESLKNDASFLPAPPSVLIRVAIAAAASDGLSLSVGDFDAILVSSCGGARRPEIDCLSETKYRDGDISWFKGSVCSLPFLPIYPLWCNFQNKTGTEPLTS